MEITEEQFKRVIRRALARGIVCAPYFQHYFSNKEQEEKIVEIIEDCQRYLHER